MKNVLVTIILYLSSGLTAVHAETSGSACFLLNPNNQPEASIAACTDDILSGHLNNTDLGIAFSNRGIASREMGNLRQSEADLRQAVKLSGKDPHFLRMLAWTLRESGELSEAEDIYSGVLQFDPHWQGWLSRCVVRIELKRYQAALQDCNTAQQQMPVMPDILFFKSYVLNILLRHDEAYKTASSGFSEEDFSGRLYHQALIALWNLYRDDEISAIIAEGLRRYPGDPDILSFQTQISLPNP